MSGIKDVIDGLGSIVQNAVYPNGLSQPSIIGSKVTIEGGWPISTQLDADLLAGNAHVSIFPTNKQKVVTKFERVFKTIQINDPTLTATVNGFDITIGGAITVPQAVVVIVNNFAYGYAALITDTLDDIAANLAVLIPGATSLGSVITVNNSTYSLIARVSTEATVGEELSRQERVFLISCWCSGDTNTGAYDPTIRDVLADAIDIQMKLNYRIGMPDGYFAQVFPMESATPYVDMLEKSLIFRRDLNYNVQYATTLIESTMTLEGLNKNIIIN